MFGLANPRREQVDNIEKSKVADASETPSNTPASTTTIVESRSSVRVGQEAFWSSPTISPIKMRVLRNGFFMDLNLAGAEGIEPPTNGFGDRYSTN